MASFGDRPQMRFLALRSHHALGDKANPEDWPAEDPKESAALTICAWMGHFACVALLAPLAPASAIPSAISWAATSGRIDCVELLISFLDGERHASRALQWAAEQGHFECVRLLLPVGNPKADNDQSLAFAAIHGHVECAMLLAPHADFSRNPEPLLLAARRGQAKTVEAMLGAHPNCSSLFNFSPLIIQASLDGHEKLAAVLLSFHERSALAESLPPLPRLLSTRL